MSYSSPPQTPGSPSGRPQSPRDQRNRTFSFRSDRSSESKSSRPKIDLKETSRDKRRLSATTKNNPNAALSEIQPSEMAAEHSAGASLRNQQFKDAYGNTITDPDTSNPTRSRMERPLDTIRGFEDRIEKEHNRRSGGGSGYQHSESILGNAGPRSSYIGNTGNTPWQSGHHQRSQSYRHDYYQQPPQRPNHYRMQSAPLSRPMPEHEVYQSYPSQEYRDSYENVNPGGSSGSPSEPWGNSTDPSSENSSVDRIQGMGGRVDYNDAYGYPSQKPRGSPMRDGYGNPMPPPQPPFDHGYGPQRQQSPRGPPYGYPPPPPPNDGRRAMTPPPPPKHEPQQQYPARNIIPLGSQAPQAGPSAPPQMQRAPQQPQQQQQQQQYGSAPQQMSMPPPPQGSQQSFPAQQQQRPAQGQRLAKRQPQAPPVTPPAEEKKKRSWLSRRLSKN